MQTLRYSALKLLPNYPAQLHNYLLSGERDKLITGVNQDQPSIRFGAALDYLLTTEQFWDKYVIAEYKEPTPMMYKFIRAYIEFEDEMLAYRFSGYKTSFNTVIKNFNTPEVQFYYEAIKNKKEVISQNTFDEIQNVANKLDKSKYKYLFLDKLTQVSLEFKFMGVDCSGTLDILDIDHNNKTIRGWDLKTSANATNFEDSYYKYGYYMQATWYNLAILYYKFFVNKDLKDYKILPFRFLVVDKILPYPLVYEVEKKYRGLSKIINLMSLWKWHINNNIFINKEHYENDYVIQI